MGLDKAGIDNVDLAMEQFGNQGRILIGDNGLSL